MDRVSARAPGKLVWLGEYAVLEGAPAIVQAVDRYALASATSTHDGRIVIEAVNLDERPLRGRCGDAGIDWDAQSPAAPLLRATCAAFFPAGVDGARITLDTSALYQGREKLGLGSSAAVVAALVAVLGKLGNTAADPARCWPALQAIHREVQDGRGSGVDLAAALYGGLLDFRAGRVTTLAPPVGLHWRAFWTGRSASTSGMLAQLARWRAGEPDTCARHLGALADLAGMGSVALQTGQVEAFLTTARAYRDKLFAFGDASGVAIGTPVHRALAVAGDQLGVVYKSCGAGGGDVGVAFAAEAGRLAAFSATAPEHGGQPLALAAAPSFGMAAPLAI